MKNITTHQKNSHYQYGCGARNAIAAFCHVIYDLKMTDEQAMIFLSEYEKILNQRFSLHDGNTRLARPFVDGCVNEALHILNDEKE